MNAKTITTNSEGIARRRVDIRTPSSAAKSPRAAELTALPRPTPEGWPFSLGLSETSCRDTKTVRPNALRVKRKSYIAKGLLLSGKCPDSYLDSTFQLGHIRHSRAGMRIPSAACCHLPASSLGAPRLTGGHLRARLDQQFAKPRSMAGRFVGAIATDREAGSRREFREQRRSMFKVQCSMLNVECSY